MGITWENPQKPAAEVISFGYAHGVPQNLDLCADTRRLPVPSHLRHCTGEDEALRRYVLNAPGAAALTSGLAYMVGRLRDDLDTGDASPARVIRIGVGCETGRRTSVAVADALRDHLGGDAEVVHRDIDRNPRHRATPPLAHRAEIARASLWLAAAGSTLPALFAAALWPLASGTPKILLVVMILTGVVNAVYVWDVARGLKPAPGQGGDDA